MEVCAPPDLHRLTDNAAINGVGRNKKIPQIPLSSSVLLLSRKSLAPADISDKDTSVASSGASIPHPLLGSGNCWSTPLFPGSSGQV